MTSLKITIKHGYGIADLKHGFDFTKTAQHAHDDTHIVYAQNGVMKSSFTKTLRDFSTPNTEIRDHIFNILGSCNIAEDGQPVDPERVLSVPSFDNSIFSSYEKMSDLLASKDLKQRYDELISEHTAAYYELLHKLKSVADVKNNQTLDDIVEQFCLSFGPNTPTGQPSFIHLIKISRNEISASPDFIADIPYRVAGEQYVADFAEKNGNFLTQFVEKYDKVLKTSAYLRGEFGTKGAEEVSKVLDKQKFFSAEHTVTLLDKTDPTKPIQHPIDNADDLTKLFESDFDRVFEDNPALKKTFKAVLKKLDQQNHSDLKTLLEDPHTRPVIALMANHTQLKKRLWFGYLKQCENEIENLLSLDEKIAEEVKSILAEAEKERTQWDEVVETFNRRFRHMPFELRVENKANILLEGIEQVSLSYYYKQPNRTSQKIAVDHLLRYLSTGERKAFYLLNLLFEVNSRKASGDTHYIILDDIVDSFDFKNKYAFLEYIYELSKDSNNLRMIILTHNFDFFRLMQSRMAFSRSSAHPVHAWFGQRDNTTNSVKLTQAGQFNYYLNTRSRAGSDDVAWLSLIPLTRNLVEYATDNTSISPEFQLLTECMHCLD
ncbi:MAG: AAA family ATPase, partial [Candidatus Saccharimonas sp.]